MIASAVLLAAGCAMVSTETRPVPPRIQGIGWIKQDWRVCTEGACPGTTPKTLVMPVAVPAPAIKPLPSVGRVPIHIHFDFAEAGLNSSGVAQLEQFLPLIRDQGILSIHGRTDARGSTKFNDRLARRRADVIAAWLKQRGVKNPMEMEAQGRCCYVASNDSEEGRAANRRVEIHFLTTKEAHS